MQFPSQLHPTTSALKRAVRVATSRGTTGNTRRVRDVTGYSMSRWGKANFQAWKRYTVINTCMQLGRQQWWYYVLVGTATPECNVSASFSYTSEI